MVATPEQEHRSAQERVTEYHEARVAELLLRVAEAMDQLRTGDLDVAGADRVIHQYHRAARELWKFCWSFPGRDQLEFVARLIRDQTHAVDWWQRGDPGRPHDR